MTQNQSMGNKKDVFVRREFEASVEQVWRAWTDPEQVIRWWGPNNFTSPSAKIDLREGGVSIVCMRAPADWGGQDFYNTWEYRKIVPLERMEYVQNLSDQDGNRIDPTTLGLRDDFPEDTQTVLTLRPLDGKTEMTVTEYGFPVGQMYEFAQLGLEQCMDKMAATFVK